MEVHLIKGNNLTFMVDDSEGYAKEHEKLSKIKNGTQFYMKISEMRCPELHRKYFVMISKAWSNYPETKQNLYTKDINRFRKAMEVKAGYYTPVQLEGLMMCIPESIAYHKLEEYDFRALFEQVFTVLMDEVFDNDFTNEFMRFGFGNDKYKEMAKRNQEVVA